MKPKLITCYAHPDLDGVACAVAYREFLQKINTNVVVKLLGEPQDEAKYIFERFGYISPDIIENGNNFDEIILVDASDLNGLEGKIDALKVIEIIDHRKINEADKFPNAKVQIELVGAAATLVAEKFIENNIEISKESATLIYGAIISNTLNFKGSVTTDRDTKAALWLNKKAKLSEAFYKELFMSKSDMSGNKLKERINKHVAIFNFGDKKICIAQIEMIGARKLVTDREGEIIEILNKIKKENNLDYIFQTTIDLEECKNFFVSDDDELKKLLEKILEVKFVGNMAERLSLIMRKQIVPLLKEELEK
jgi:manganese-dependent inorganic pyrophosphatase